MPEEESLTDRLTRLNEQVADLKDWAAKVPAPATPEGWSHIPAQLASASVAKPWEPPMLLRNDPLAELERAHARDPSFKNNIELRAAYLKQPKNPYRDWYGSLPQDERQAVDKWISGHAYEWRMIQRGERKPGQVALKDINLFEKALAKAPLTTDTIYRGMDRLPQSFVDNFRDPRAIFENAAHSSSSTNPKIAQDFARVNPAESHLGPYDYLSHGTSDYQHMVFEINGVHPGLNPIGDKTFGIPYQREVIMPQGDRYEVKDFKENHYGPYQHHVILNQLPKDFDVADRPVFKLIEPGELLGAGDVLTLPAWAATELHQATGLLGTTGAEPGPNLYQTGISGRPAVKPGTGEEFQEGGQVSGKGNTDSIKAALTPGEFVVNKQATKDNLPLLQALNEAGKDKPGSNIPPWWIFDQDPTQPGWTPGWAPLIDPLEPPPWEPQLAAKRNGKVYAQGGGLIPPDVAYGDTSEPGIDVLDGTQTTDPMAILRAAFQEPGSQQSQAKRPTIDPKTGIFTPGRPDYLKYNQTAHAGFDNMRKMFESLYKEPNTKNPIKDEYHDDNVDDTTHAELTTNPSPPTKYFLNPATGSYEPILDENNQVTGLATTFGLQPNAIVNADGTVDAKWFDPMDKGKGAFGYNTRDPTLAGGSLPVDVIKATIGDYTTDPAMFQKVKNEYHILATNSTNGRRSLVPFVDAGPGLSTGNVADFTYKTTKDLGLTGKDKVTVQIIGPDGTPIPIRGYHPYMTTRAPAKSQEDLQATLKKAQKALEENTNRLDEGEE